MQLICSLFITFLKIGAFTFGGGYAMIALLENEFVEKKKWLEKSEFLDMVAVAESTPGPVAINSATYIGYKIAGFAGAAMSTLAVCIPSFFVIYGISLFFDQFLSLRWVSCAFHGIQVCVVYLILTAGLKMLKSIDKKHTKLDASHVGHGFHALLLDHSSFVFLCVLHPDLRRGRACCFLSAKNPERRWENVMIYLRLFLNF